MASIFYADGLAAAFRITDDDDSLVDLSGNGHTLQAVGSPSRSTALSNWRRGSFWSIGNRPGQADNVFGARVTEAIFYNKALSELEVMQQFSLSEGHLNSKGITIADQPTIADS